MGPHYGLRAKCKTDTADMLVPEIVLPLTLSQAVKRLAKEVLVVAKSDKEATMSRAEARIITQCMVPAVWKTPTNGSKTTRTILGSRGKLTSPRGSTRNSQLQWS